jgi:hypothetical protein
MGHRRLKVGFGPVSDSCTAANGIFKVDRAGDGLGVTRFSGQLSYDTKRAGRKYESEILPK